MKAGYHFGNLQVFNGSKSEFTYTALQTVRALILPKNKFLQILNKYPEIKKHMIDYAFKMAKQTYKAMVKTILFSH